MDVLASFVTLALLLGFYYLPTIIAWRRHKVSLLLFFIMNTLFGWTVLGWFWGLFKALSTTTADQLNSGISVRGISDRKA